MISGIVQLDSVAVDVGQFHDRASPTAFPPDIPPSLAAMSRRAPDETPRNRAAWKTCPGLAGAENRREAAEHIFEHRHVLFQMRLELHAELGQRSAGDHRDFFGDAGLNQARAVYHRVHRPGAKRFGIRARRIAAAGILGDRLGEIAAAAIITVAHRFFRTTDDEIDFIAVLTLSVLSTSAQRMRGGNFAGQDFPARLPRPDWHLPRGPLRKRRPIAAPEYSGSAPFSQSVLNFAQRLKPRRAADRMLRRARETIFLRSVTRSNWSAPASKA